MENGVWRTIRGRRVFIKDGEDLESAMKRSGKFGKSLKETQDLYKDKIKKEQIENRRISEERNYAKRKYGELSEEYEKWDNEFKNSQGRIAKLQSDSRIAEHETINRITRVDLPNEFGIEIKENQLENLRKVGREVRAREIDKINQPAGEQTRQLIEEMNVKTFADEIEDRELLARIGKTKEEQDAILADREARTIHFAGEELYSDDPNRYESALGMSMKEYNEKMQNYGVSPMSEWSDTTGTGLSDTQSTALSKMSLSELRNMANEYDINTKGKSKKQLLGALISMFNK